MPGKANRDLVDSFKNLFPAEKKGWYNVKKKRLPASLLPPSRSSRFKKIIRGKPNLPQSEGWPARKGA
jgi:hypothetical protein